jgi:hypothetical protein
MEDIATNKTVYSFTMELNGNVYQSFMTFIPQNTNPIDADEKYFVYSYKYVIYLMNNMIEACLDGLNAIESTGITIPPRMYFDVDTQLCSMGVDDANFGFNEAGKINMYMNTQCYAMMSSLSSSTVFASQGRDYQLNNMISDDPSYITQEYKTIELWNPVSTVVFTTNTLPIYESVSAPLQIYLDGQLSDNNSSYNFLNVMTDFIGNEMLFVPYIQYAPTIYRFLNLKPNNDIRNIDVQVFWMDKNSGKLRKLYLIPGGSCSLKLYITND